MGLTAGTGTGTFFVDARAQIASRFRWGAAADTWSTVAKFHSGGAATLWGVSAATPQQWADGQGAAGATGLTLHAGGRITASFGRDAASGSDCLHLRAA